MYDSQHPLRIFLILLTFVFVVELGIMYLLAIVEVKPVVNWTEAFIDATLLTVLSVPFFWFLVVKPLQNALELESIKSHKILEMAAEGIVSIDTGGKLLSFNRAAQKIFGYSEEEVIGKNVSLLMPAPHRDNHDEYLSRYLQTSQPHVIGKTREVQGRRKDGTPFPLELSVTEVKYGDAHFFTAMLRDVSEQKLALKRIEQLAHYDELTHLPNRTLFYDRLGQAIVAAKRQQADSGAVVHRSGWLQAGQRCIWPSYRRSAAGAGGRAPAAVRSRERHAGAEARTTICRANERDPHRGGG